MPRLKTPKGPGAQPSNGGNMKTITQITVIAAIAGFVLLGAAPLATADGAVYAMTNAVGNNQILVYHRAANGTLVLMQTIATGGGGGGAQLSPPVDSLGSQGGLILDHTHSQLFAVNTETLAENSQDCQIGTISSFTVATNGTLTFADKVSSGGLYPDSLTIHGNVLYVLNAGGPGSSPACGIGPNINGFKTNPKGIMTPLANSLQPIDPGALDGTGSGVNCNVGGFPVPAFDCGRNPPAFPRSPAEVRFTTDGSQLLVTVKGTNTIYVFPVAVDGTVGTPTITQAPGPSLPTYSGFTFDKNGHLLMTEAFGSSTSIPKGGAGAVSSFTIGSTGSLQQISADVGDGGTFAGSVALDPVGGRYLYVGNSLSNSLSSYTVGGDGTLTLLNSLAASDAGPNDMAVAREGQTGFLYALASGTGTVDAYLINSDGSLTSLGSVGGLPVNDAAQGLAAY
jgi:6-phosphogluconolactonase